MNSLFSFVVGLLTSALSLMGFVQQHPELPQASRDQAQQVAQQAITQATNVLNNAQPNPQPVPNNSVNFTASPASGSAPSSVAFSASGPINDFPSGIDFGDGSQGFVEGLHDCAGGCTSQSIDGFQISHIYKNSGTYTATLTANAACYTIAPCPSKKVVGSETITITNSNLPQPSATIDQGALTQKIASGSSIVYPNIAGTASGTNQILFEIKGSNYDATPAKVANGHWSLTYIDALSVGSYTAEVFDSSTQTLLATATLIVTQ